MIYTNNLKQFKGQAIKITKVSPFYFSGYTPHTWFRTYLPTDDKFGMMEKKWNKEQRTFEQIPVKLSFETIAQTKADGTPFEWKTFVIEVDGIKYPFFKTFKKVYDITINTETEQSILKYKDVYEFGNEITIQGVWAGKLWQILENVVEVEIPLWDNGFPMRDWEEEYVHKLVDVSFKFTVRGEWLATKYTWKEAKFATKQTESKIETLEGDDIFF